MSEPQDQDQAQLYQQIIEKCWTDDDFKQQLLAEPMATLKAEGLEIPEGLSVKVLENTQDVFHIVIPATTQAISDTELNGISAGGADCSVESTFQFTRYSPACSLASVDLLKIAKSIPR